MLNLLREPVEIKGGADWHVKWWQWTTSASVTGSVTLITSHCWQETHRGDHLSSNPSTFGFSFIVNSGDYLILYCYCCQHISNSTYYSVSVVQLMQWLLYRLTIYLNHHGILEFHVMRHNCYLSYQYSNTDIFKEGSKVQKQYYTMKWFSMLRMRTILKDETDMYQWKILKHSALLLLDKIYICITLIFILWTIYPPLFNWSWNITKPINRNYATQMKSSEIWALLGHHIRAIAS